MKGRIKGSYSSPESLAIGTMSAGHVFYTSKSQKDLWAIASVHGKKIKTSRCIVIDDLIKEQPVLNKITKVIIL